MQIYRQNLQGGSQVKGYSHTVCVNPDNADSWKSEGYEVIQESTEAILLGKRKVKKRP